MNPSFSSLKSLAYPVIRILVYSGSRLAVSITPALLTPFILRLVPPPEANRLLVALAIATFGSNVCAAWLEQVMYRFPMPAIQDKVRKVAIVECFIVTLVIPIFLHLAGSWLFHEVPLGPLFTSALILLIIADVFFRISIAILQMTAPDRVFVRHNFARFSCEFLLGIGILFRKNSVEFFLLGLAFVRVISAMATWQTSRIPTPPKSSEPSRSDLWISYGLSISLWFAFYQLILYVPQFASVFYQTVEASTAFLAAFRIFLQSGLLFSAILLLYIHPKLLRCFHEQGAQAFLQTWSRWFSYYALAVSGFVAVFGFLFPLVSKLLLTDTYAASSTPILYTLPGIVFWSLANYVQKLIEVTGRIVVMVFALLVSLVVLFGTLFAASPSHIASMHFNTLASLSLSLTFGVYLIIITRKALIATRGIEEEPSPCRELLLTVYRVGWVSILAIAAILFAEFHN